MPVVATLTVIALLRGDGEKRPFFDPELLRNMLTDGLDKEADDNLEAALAIVEELELEIQHYFTAVDATLDAFLEESENPASDASDLIARLLPLDRARADVMGEIIDIRRDLKRVLDQEQWDRVFA